MWIEGDVTFNESLASFVGEAGALLWLQQKYGKDASVVQQVLDAGDDAIVFRGFMHQIAAELDSLYQSDLDRETKVANRQAIFDRAKEAYYHLPLKTHLYDGFPTWSLNNARMALYRVYRARTDVFERVFERVNKQLPEAISVLKRCETASDPSAYLEKWLEEK